MKSMKDIVPRMVRLILFFAMVYLIGGVIMVNRTLMPLMRNYNAKVEFYNYMVKTEIYNHVFILDTYETDSINGTKFNSVLHIEDDFYHPQLKILGSQFDLIHNLRARKITLFFAFYYIGITILWMFVFYNLLMFVISHKNKKYFLEMNEKRLRNSGRLIVTIFIYQMFGIQIITFLVGINFDIFFGNPDYDYDGFTRLLLLSLLGGLLKVISIGYKNGFNMEMDQEYTV